MEEQIRQAQEKQEKEIAERLKRKEEELRNFLKSKNDLERIKQEREIDIFKRRKDFLTAIDEMKTHKQMKNKLEKANSNEYHYDYFPFTHGEQYEEKKKQLVDNHREALARNKTMYAIICISVTK